MAKHMNELESRIRESLNEDPRAALDAYSLSDMEVLDLLESDQYDHFSCEFRVWLDKQMDAICERQGQ